MESTSNVLIKLTVLFSSFYQNSPANHCHYTCQWNFHKLDLDFSCPLVYFLSFIFNFFKIKTFNLFFKLSWENSRLHNLGDLSSFPVIEFGLFIKHQQLKREKFYKEGNHFHNIEKENTYCYPWKCFKNKYLWDSVHSGASTEVKIMLSVCSPTLWVRGATRIYRSGESSQILEGKLFTFCSGTGDTIHKYQWNL